MPHIRLWLDDERAAPDGWQHVRTASEAILRLLTGQVAEISLDHDLGEPSAGTGYDVACAIEKLAAEGRLPMLTWSVHSANPVGRRKIQAALLSAERWWR